MTGKSSSIFDNQRYDAPSFILAGKMTNYGDDTKGPGRQVSLMVDWSVYDVNSDKVVFELETAGYSDSRTGLKLYDEINLALKDALIGLISNGEFQKLVLKKEVLKSSDDDIYLTVNQSNIKKITEPTIADFTKSVVTIKTYNAHGSGFIISEDGYILTNEHVVGRLKSVNVIFDNGITLQGEVIKTSKKRDIALVKIPGKGYKPLKIHSDLNSQKIGSEVFAIGTPADIDLGQTVTKGILSGVREKENQEFIQTDVSISPGSSGGPLINEKGEVIGVVVSKIKGIDVEGVGFAIPIEDAVSVLKIRFQ